MVQVFQDQPSFASQLARGGMDILGSLGKEYLGNKLAQRQQDQMQRSQQMENRQIFEQTGIDLSGISDPKMREKLLESGIKSGHQRREKMAPLEGAMQTIQRMRQLGETGHLGPKISQLGGVGFLNPDVRKNRAEYEQLGKSLISMASTIPIRNQLEFEVLSSNLYDPTLTDASRAGILDSMERIIRNSMREYTGGLESGMEFEERKEAPKKKQRLTYFGH